MVPKMREALKYLTSIFFKTQFILTEGLRLRFRVQALRGYIYKAETRNDFVKSWNKIYQYIIVPIIIHYTPSLIISQELKSIVIMFQFQNYVIFRVASMNIGLPSHGCFKTTRYFNEQTTPFATTTRVLKFYSKGYHHSCLISYSPLNYSLYQKRPRNRQMLKQHINNQIKNYTTQEVEFNF